MSFAAQLAVRTAPLSFNQRQIWFLHRIMPESPAYNVPVSLRFGTPVDVRALNVALNSVIRAHEILRTRFTESDGEPLQVIEPGVQLSIAEESLVDSIDAEHALAVRLGEESRRLFDLEQVPLVRARLIQLPRGESVFSLVLHHILADGWSLSILFDEMERRYSAELHGGTPISTRPQFQYADYAVWQRARAREGAFRASRDYWKHQLSGAPECLNLPVDGAHSDALQDDGSGESFVLREAVLKQLRRIAQRCGASLQMALLTAYVVLLHRYGGQEQVLVGIPSANREREEWQNVIGFFTNILVIRVDVAGNPSFIELLKRVRQTCLEAYEHQDVPFELLVEELKPERRLGKNPFFQTDFLLITREPGRNRQPGAWPPFRELTNGTCKFDLGAVAVQTPAGLSIELRYNSHLFRAETAARMRLHFEKLLEQTASTSGCGVSTQSMLLPEELRIAERWRQNKTRYPRQERVENLFAKHVESAPDAVALRYPSVSLTYQELDNASNRVAVYLAQHGVVSESVVGVCMERSWQMIVALLGVLKAGATYLPLDPSYPITRLQFMSDDAQVGVMLMQRSLQPSLRGCVREVVPCICLEDIPGEVGISITNRHSASHLAYIVYTSGSTGTPKGIGIPHHGITRLVRNTDYLQLGPEDRIGQASNASFDALTFEVWGALLNGASVVGLTREESLNAELLANRIRQDKITTLFLTTALFNQIAAGDHAHCFKNLRYLLVGGERADPKSFRDVAQHYAPANLLHVYGPTENTTFSLWQHIQSVEQSATSVAIGGPIANTEAYVLNRHLAPVATGVVGELYLGGDGLARGYVDRPSLTAEKFVPNPFATSESSRLYRTGDLVRYGVEGAIEFVGRTDYQVKIRGFRLELGEIETVLRRHAGVRDAVVFVDEAGGEKRLVGFVVSDGGGSKRELDDYLRERLPAYMVPDALLILSELPLTANGKIDRAALLAQMASEIDAQRLEGWVGPRNSLEHSIAQVLADILQAKRVGVHDDVFELGANSLLLMRIHARLRKVLPPDRPIKITDLFLYPTIDSLVRARLS